MKACMVAYTFYENDMRVRRYAETLSKNGFEVFVVSLRQKSQKKFEILNNVKIYRIQKRQVNERSKLQYLLRIIEFLFRSTIFITKESIKNKIDIIHVHSVPDFEVFSAIFAKLRNSIIILDIHDIVPEFYASKFKVKNSSSTIKLLKIIEYLSCCISDYVIIANDIWKNKLVKRSVQESKCTAFINYPDTRLFGERKNYSSDKFTFLYPGTLNWHQGLDIAINAFEIAQKKFSNNVEFCIYGEGPSKEKLIESVKGKKLESKIKFYNSVSIEEIAKIMSEADVGVIPKRNDPFGGDAFSTKSLEFMAAGIPVLMSKTRIDNYYFNNKEVLFFNPEDEKDLSEKMIQIANNSQLREKLVKNGKELSRKLSWDNYQNQYLKIISNLLRRK